MSGRQVAQELQIGSTSQKALAIICGGGSLPFAVADAARRQGRGIVLFGLRGWADPDRIAAYPHHWLWYGQFGRFCQIAHREGCHDVVFIGSLVRPSFWQIRPDLAALRYMPQVIQLLRGGDDRVLSGILRIFEQVGFRLIGAHEIAPEILMPEGPLGRLQPSAAQQEDIALGLALLAAIGEFDVGQAAVVADGQVLTVEAAGGTDEMLVQLAELRRKGRIKSTGGVLVKAPKQGQDRRIDLPAIGPRTIARAADAELAGIAVVAEAAIMAEPDEVARAADRAGLFVVGVRQGGRAP